MGPADSTADGDETDAAGANLDPEEVGDWLDSLDAAQAHHGPEAVTELLARLQSLG